MTSPDVTTEPRPLPSLCVGCSVRINGVCSALGLEHLHELSRHAKRTLLPSGKELVVQGEPSDTYSNMVHGVVKLTKFMADGRQQIVSIKFAPTLVGKFAAKESAVSALTATDAQVCSFPSEVLERIALKSPAVENRMHQQALRELDEARDWMLALGRKNAQEKLATFLLMVGRNNSRDNQPRSQFQLPLSRTEIADFLGLTIETVSRQLTRLRQSNVITLRDSRHVTINDASALEHLSDLSLSHSTRH